MNNHLLHMLREWQPLRDELEWVFGIIYKTEGSCYRKAGAMVLLSNMGHQLGVLSGGCLESDIQRNARKVMQDGRPRCLTYDDNDEDDIAFRLGIGCGGVVHLMLVSVNASNNYLSLNNAFEALQTNQPCEWAITIPTNTQQTSNTLQTRCTTVNTAQHSTVARLEREQQSLWLTTQLTPPPHLLLIGGGYDAVPVAQGAINLGWTVSLWDPRPAQGRQEHFAFITSIIQETDASALAAYTKQFPVDAVIMMSHNKDIDSRALQQLYDKPLKYIAMIGPEHRRLEVVERAEIPSDAIQAKFVGPVGLDIGGDLPESIALSMLAECHAVIYAASGKSLSNVL